MWLTRDEDNGQLVALKIHIAITDAEAYEPFVIVALKEAEFMLTEMVITGSKWRSSRSTEVPNPNTLAMFDRRMPVDVAKKVMEQLLKAVKISLTSL